MPATKKMDATAKAASMSARCHLAGGQAMHPDLRKAVDEVGLDDALKMAAIVVSWHMSLSYFDGRFELSRSEWRRMLSEVSGRSVPQREVDTIVAFIVLCGVIRENRDCQGKVVDYRWSYRLSDLAEPSV